MTSFQLLSFISANSVLLPTLLALFSLKYLRTASLKILFIFLVSSSIKEIVCTYFALNGIDNYPIYNVLSILYYGLILLMYQSYFEGKKVKNFITLLLLIFTSLYLANIIFIQKLHKLNSFTFIFGGFCVTLICLLFFYKLLTTSDVRIIKLPFFWFSTGFVFYSTGTIILISFFEFYKNLPPTIGAKLWGINSILNIALNVLITIGLYWKRNTQT